ncbi:MAX dimerization protein MGA a [Polymixia lowei]
MHIISTDDNLEMEVDFSNTEAVSVTCPPLGMITANKQGPSQQAQPPPANKTLKCKKKSRQAQTARTDLALNKVDSTYTSKQPNLEEVEEQLFVSFTSKEALNLHVGGPSEGQGITAKPQRSSVTQTQQTTEATKNVETPESLEERIVAFETVLLRDLKLMKHRQVIHPVLQEVGLKLSLLDPKLAIDLQYLGVRLPIPPPGVSLEPLSEALAPVQSVSAAFVSRTGKTTDFTQIKGWRDKFAPSESSSAPSSSKPEAGPSSDVPSRNLSAFCSDMLDEYLENEGRLIDERAASFSQATLEPVSYELPTRSTSYVRTLDSILKKQTQASPTSALISSFVPPSKRPKPSAMGPKKSKGEKRQNAIGSKQNKLGTTVSTVSVPTANNLTPPSEQKAPITKAQHDPVLRFKSNKLKTKASCQTPGPFPSKTAQLGVSKDLAPLDSDSELGTAAEPSDRTVPRPDAKPLVTKALLKQKDLEDGVVWEGRPKTCITAERAAIALTSLFTLVGFVREDPTAPIQVIRRRAPPCLNDFCRLGCVCASLNHTRRVTHCGKTRCMFGCSCLRQKVVLLKNLEGPDSSPSDQGKSKKRKKKKRMKMAYILKEAESVAQPAQWVRTLWRTGSGDRDPEPIHAPQPCRLPGTAESDLDMMSCARVRGYGGRKTRLRNHNPTTEKESSGHSTDGKLKPTSTDVPPKKAKLKSSHPPADPCQSPAQPNPTPSKRLVIIADCRWSSSVVQTYVLKKICEAMAQDLLNNSFWVKNYFITPLCQERMGDGCIYYKVHISEGKLDPSTGTMVPLTKPPDQDKQQETGDQETVERQGEKEEEEEGVEDWQREVEEDDLLNMEEAEGREKTGEQIQVETEKMRMMKMGLPFLTGTSAAGFLSANIKQPGGTNLLVQVNGKPYPLAKIQLGKMGALHPANRLAAYLTGRVRSSRPQQAPSPASSSSHPPQKPADSQSSALAPPDHRSAVSMSPSVASTPTTTKPKVTMSSYPPGSVEPKAAVTQVTTSVVSPLNQSLGNVGHNIPQVLVPLSGTSRPPQSVGSEPRRMVLQTVRTQSGQLYQKLDGKLVQLVPLSQLRAVNPGLVVQRAPSVVQGNVVTQPSAASLAPPPASLSGLQTFSVPPLPLSQQGTCTLQIIPAGNREPLTVTCPKVPSKTRVATASTSFTLLRPSCPAQNALISLQTPGSQGAEPGVKTLSVSAGRAAAGRVVDLSRLIPHPQTKAQSQPTTTQNQAGTSSRAPAQPAATQLGSVTQPSSCPSIDLSAITSPELALHTDLDIITVTDETENHPGKPPVDRAKGSRDGPSLDRREKKKEKGEVVVLVESSDEADGSSDIMDDSDNNSVPDLAEHISKSIHNALERNRRMKLTECFDGLRKELGLTNEKTPKITILNKAQQEVQTLRRTRRTLERQRRSLRKERTERIITISQMSGKTADVIYSDVQRLSKTQESAQSDSSDHSSGTPSDNLLLGGAGSEPPLVADEMEVVDLLEETDEQTDHSSDEENVITNKNIITINSDDDVSDVESVDIETVDECSLFSLAERKLAAVRKSLDLDPSLREKGAAARTEAGFQALSLVMNVQTGSKRFLLQQACREIHTLQDQGETLERLRSGLSHQRTSYIREISIRSGKSEECILKKLQHLSAKQRRLEQETHSATTAQPPGGSAAKQPPPGGSAAEQPPPGGSAAEQPPPGGSAAEQPLRDTNRHSALSMAQPKSLPQTPLPQPQVQPTPWAGPLLQPQAQQAAQPAQQSHTSGHGVGVVQSATLDASSLSHNAPGFRDKPKTIPNILSHRKQPSVHSEPVQALVPGEVLTLLGATLPRQQILHLSPLATGPTFLHTSPTPGVASVTLNISNLANQQIPVSSLSRPPLGKVYSTTALLTAPATNLTACSFPTMLHLVHSQPEQPLPQTQQHQQTPTQQPEPHQPTQPQQTQQAVSSGAAVVRMLSEPLTKTQEVPTLASTQTQNQVHSPGTPVLSGPSPQGTSPSPQQSAGAVAWHPASPPPREEEEEEAKMNLSSSRCREVSTAPEEVKVKEEVGEGSDGESLTSLLNEIVFLNQQVCGADGVTLSTLPRKPSSEPGPSTLTGAPLGMESMGGAQEEGEVGGGMDKSCSLSPLFLELDEDPIESSTENTVVLNGHNQTGPASGADSSTSPATNRQSQLHNPQCTAKGGTLTPPPLLQMKVGRVGDRAKTVESTNERAEGQESGLQWRPMPRLVPLGLKNNAQPSV